MWVRREFSDLFWLFSNFQVFFGQGVGKKSIQLRKEHTYGHPRVIFCQKRKKIQSNLSGMKNLAEFDWISDYTYSWSYWGQLTFPHSRSYTYFILGLEGYFVTVSTVLQTQVFVGFTNLFPVLTQWLKKFIFDKLMTNKLLAKKNNLFVSHGHVYWPERGNFSYKTIL